MHPALLTLVGLTVVTVGCYRTHERVLDPPRDSGPPRDSAPRRDSAPPRDSDIPRDSGVDAFRLDAPGPDAAFAATELFPTGVDEHLTPLEDDSDDPHWTAQIEGMSAAPARALPPTNFCSSCGGVFLHHPQPTTLEGSRPIFAAPPTSPTQEGVRVRYATAFVVPTGASLGSESAVTFLVGYDNFTLDAEGHDAPADTAIALVNGSEIRRPCRDGFPGSFDTTCSFSIPGTALRIGFNTLEFRVRNEGGPYGFRVRSVVTRY